METKRNNYKPLRAADEKCMHLMRELEVLKADRGALDTQTNITNRELEAVRAEKKALLSG